MTTDLSSVSRASSKRPPSESKTQSFMAARNLIICGGSDQHCQGLASPIVIFQDRDHDARRRTSLAFAYRVIHRLLCHALDVLSAWGVKMIKRGDMVKLTSANRRLPTWGPRVWPILPSFAMTFGLRPTKMPVRQVAPSSQAITERLQDARRRPKSARIRHADGPKEFGAGCRKRKATPRTAARLASRRVHYRRIGTHHILQRGCCDPLGLSAHLGQR
jgi:hypothetical protein